MSCPVAMNRLFAFQRRWFRGSTDGSGMVILRDDLIRLVKEHIAATRGPNDPDHAGGPTSNHSAEHRCRLGCIRWFGGDLPIAFSRNGWTTDIVPLISQSDIESKCVKEVRYSNWRKLTICDRINSDRLGVKLLWSGSSISSTNLDTVSLVVNKNRHRVPSAWCIPYSPTPST